MSRVMAQAVHHPKPEHRAGLPVIGAAIADVPFDVWERQPSTMTFLPQVA